MYKTLLILRYLRKRRIAWVSLIAVTLCTAMVIIVISVMGGWLRMFRESFHGLTGDVIVHGDLQGFPYYEEMIQQLQKRPEIKAAVPTIDTFGLINIKNIWRQGVRVFGYPLDRIGEVNRFPQSLYRQYQRYKDAAKDHSLTDAERQHAAELAAKHEANPNWNLPLSGDEYRDIVPRGTPDKWRGMIVAIGVLGLHKNADGTWPPREGIYEAWVHLTVLGISANSLSPDAMGGKREENYWIVDDSRTEIWQYDQASVYVPFDDLQKNLDMDAHDETDPDTGEKRTIPARTTDLQIAAAPGFTLAQVKDATQKVIDAVTAEHQIGERYPIKVRTWEETQATFIGAVEHEKGLVTFLFGIISIVAIFLIFCIFYMIVVEKVRDIGIIKSVGATNAGVAGIFLGYGLAIGVVGAGLGLLSGYLIVHNINELHAEFAKLTGTQIWSAETYVFDTIPNTLNPPEVAVIVIVALVSAVLGAVVPAIRAARLNPVEALRWE